ncbi:hypothetical protein ACULZG_000907 [Listeria monocytogenes]|uniref:Uncharacterized protein n=72 Tax=Listeria monocytogenes TaxID=1639 RepID=A0A9P2CH43_LISMN|nr:hypothetical protein [Listeria monocytogenes]EAG6270106.1 hypothetical protein [Listeria monocytogenes CFSAN003726]EAG6273648.1 hypothetical protein [Listeria monocytogenes CFSAN003808]EAG6279530.1 hypothetical protein [Listeria monocytogenes CFSAN003809]EAG6358225.1 hypothetical protein [Listeria monocytogenes CFSAN003729]EAG6367268.1 hypothetical protein [Listeria monocytogenes CFSAN003728]EHC5242915.1 hypothetical protein [Listeria monocytogenes serotype 1/2a]
MFKILNLNLINVNKEEYTYSFKAGINFFKGKNDSGKTEFYKFIDFMFGSSYDISNIPWYENLEKAVMVFQKDGIKYKIVRTKNSNINYFDYIDEPNYDNNEIDFEEYKAKLMAVFSPNEKNLRELRAFIDEDITYRTFTLFNFLGETRQGVVNDFFDKSHEIKYALKLDSILNFIFNKNLEAINQLKIEFNSLTSDVNKIQAELESNNFIRKRINGLLLQLGVKKIFNGKNSSDIYMEIEKFEKMEEKPTNDKVDLSSLEIYYNTLSEQINEYDKIIQDSKQIENDNRNRESLLRNLQELVRDKKDYQYLINPIISTLNELENSISFSRYVRQDEVVKKLKEQKNDVKDEIQRQSSKFKMYSFNEKTEKIVILKDLLGQKNNEIDLEDLEKKKRRIKDIRYELKKLQNSEDKEKLNKISNLMTTLYKSSKEISTISKTDFNNEGFHLEYIKKGNSIQTIIFDELNDKKDRYYIGSMARHTMMQLCGYLSFLVMMIKEDRYPLIPFLVLDHISKQFDKENGKAIGSILAELYKNIDKEDLQIFIFDDETCENLNISADYSENLLLNNKTGFVPFYKPELK